MSRVEGCLFCQEMLVCPRHDTSTEIHVNRYVDHYEQKAKQHWTERNDRPLTEEN